MLRYKIAQLKAHLSEVLGQVQRGHTITVMARERPIARLVPYEEEAKTLVVRHPITDLHAVKLPPPLERPVDSLAALLEERGDR